MVMEKGNWSCGRGVYIFNGGLRDGRSSALAGRIHIDVRAIEVASSTVVCGSSGRAVTAKFGNDMVRRREQGAEYGAFGGKSHEAPV